MTDDGTTPWDAPEFAALVDVVAGRLPTTVVESSAIWDALEPLLRADVETQADWLDGLLWHEPPFPVWLWLLLFQTIWNQRLATDPPSLRRLLLPWMSLEGDAIRDDFLDLTERCRRACLHLRELLDDDLNWTGYTLPGE